LLISATQLESLPKTEICIVGGGAIGLSLAARLAETGVEVLLVEAGGPEPSVQSQAFYAGQVVDPAVHWPLDTYRVRALGGTTGLWGGRVVPYDPIDFEERAWVPYSGWPISFAEVAAYYPAAVAACEAGSYDFTPPGPLVPNLDGDLLHTTLERFSRPTQFWRLNGERLRKSRTVRVAVDAAVTAIRLNHDRTRVTGLEVTMPDGRRLPIEASSYVLAMGGLETTRLLLNTPDLPGGEADGWLGRGYMCHLAATLGEVHFTGPSRAIAFDYFRDAAGVYMRRRLALTAEAQRQNQVMNLAARLHIRDHLDPAHGDPVLSLMYLAAFVIKYEYSRAAREADRSAKTYARHLLNLLAHPVQLFRFLSTWGVKRYFGSRKIPSIVLFSKHNRYPLEFSGEQAPNRDSRVRLCDERDAFGVRRLEIDWRITALDVETVTRSYQVIGRELERTGTGRLDFDPETTESAILQAGAYGGHHSGTTRMAADPRHGVVDGNCRVHGLANLFVASTSVLPTSSQANPTLTGIALGLRLGDHLLRQRPEAA